MEDTPRDECPICLTSLEESSVMSTFCCNQRMHTKCFDETVLFYDGRKRDTPCPMCRTVVAEHVAVAIDLHPGESLPDAGPEPRRRTSFATRRTLLYALVVVCAHGSLFALYMRIFN